jgi:hypothetical protein
MTLHTGDIVFSSAGEWHWHGAAPDRFMTHFAMSEGEAEWGEHVTKPTTSGRPASEEDASRAPVEQPRTTTQLDNHRRQDGSRHRSHQGGATHLGVNTGIRVSRVDAHLGAWPEPLMPSSFPRQDPKQMEDPVWRCRFRATRMRVPRWASDQPDRVIYLSNALVVRRR